jgi:hypothetical protein
LQFHIAETVAWHLNAALALAAAARLLTAGLWRVYPVLTAYLLFMAARSFLLMYLQSDLRAYAWAYVLTTPLVYLLTAWAGLEVYRLVLEAYNRLSALGRKTMGITVAAGALLAYLHVHAGSRVTGEPFPVLRFVLLFEAWVAFTVLFFQAAIICFILWFPVPLKRNVVAYAFGLCLLLATTCAGIAVRVFGGAGVVAVGSTAIMAVSAAVFGAWAAYLGRAGERALTQGAVPRSAEDQERLLEQLRSINSLVESARNN